MGRKGQRKGQKGLLLVPGLSIHMVMGAAGIFAFQGEKNPQTSTKFSFWTNLLSPFSAPVARTQLPHLSSSVLQSYSLTCLAMHPFGFRLNVPASRKPSPSSQMWVRCPFGSSSEHLPCTVYDTLQFTCLFFRGPGVRGGAGWSG